MGQIALLFVLKIVTLLAAIAQAMGFVALFAIEALDPYKWQLLFGGTAVILISEGLSTVLAKRMAASGNEVSNAR
jgi:hypothetical protein